MAFKRIILLVMDSVGIGELPDSEQFGDKGADTLGHIDSERGLDVPNLERMGMGRIRPFKTIQADSVDGAWYGKMAEGSQGKDTITGHWEFMGIVLEKGFPVYPDGFPDDLIQLFKQETGLDVLGNKPASGTVIIEELGDEHIQSGKPIVYTSADSVFQIAASEQTFSLKKLYEICDITRNKVTVGDHAVSRVIARPFVKEEDGFKRTENRKDYSLEAPYPTAMDLLKEHGLEVGAIGKIEDMFVGRGITHSIHSHNNQESCQDTLKMMETVEQGLIFANFVDFDMLYGHRRNVDGYGQALEDFDSNLKLMVDALKDDDLLIITADHGCDPAFKGSDHTREYVPLLVYSKSLKGTGSLGIRTCFADISATVLDNFKLSNPLHGTSFLGELS